jgi:hypothetical protein
MTNGGPWNGHPEIAGTGTEFRENPVDRPVPEDRGQSPAFRLQECDQPTAATQVGKVELSFDIAMMQKLSAFWFAFFEFLGVLRVGF